jgi:hypothetical protein
MKPIRFACEETVGLAAADIAGMILDLAQWPHFQGYGPVPGIQAAEFAVRTPGVVGTRIRVRNRDGSRHVEEIVEWQPEQRLRLEMKEFSRPLGRLATRIEETWEFRRVAGGTHVRRTFQLYPTTRPAKLVLWVISRFLKRAIARQLEAMRGAA